MSGDPLKPLRPGDPFPTSAKTWNPLLKLARRSETSPLPSAPPIANSNSQTIVLVKNVGPFDLERFAPFMLQGTSILDSSAPTWGITPSINPDVVNRPVMLGREHLGNQRRHAVTLEPIKVGQYGQAVIAGAVPCKVWTDTESAPTHAEPFFEASQTHRTRMVGAFCGYPILSRERGTGEKWALILLGQKTPARAHFWRQYSLSVPLYGATFTGGLHNIPAPLWSSNFQGRTNAPHIFDKRTDGVYFKNRDPRYFRAFAKFRVAAGTTNQTAVWVNIYMVLNLAGTVEQTSYIQLGQVGHNLAGSGGNPPPAFGFQAEASHGMIFTAYKPSDTSDGSRLCLNGFFQTQTPNVANVGAEIRDAEIWIEEIEDGMNLRTMTTTPPPGSTNINGSAAQSNASITSSGTGSGTVEPAEEPT